MTLDVKTLLSVICLVMTFSTLALTFLFILVKQYQEIKIWALGNACLTLGFFLLYLTGKIPTFFSLYIANSLLGAGILIIFYGISSFLGRPRKSIGFILTVIAYFVLFMIFSNLTDRMLVKLLLVSVSAGIFIALIGILIIVWTPKPMRISHWFTACIFILMGAAQFIRGNQIYTGKTLVDLFPQAGTASINYSALVCFTVFWTFAAFFMITQRLSVELSETSRIDFLTRAFNRRAGQDRLEQEVRRVQRKNGVFTLVLIDIDDFTDINETYGHPGGDSALVQIADILKLRLRKEDMLSRWGGDEFMILLADAPQEGAVEVAKRLQATIKSRGINYRDHHFDCTLSIGIATFCGSEGKLDETLTGLENALNEAKALGGNKINVFHRHIS